MEDEVIKIIQEACALKEDIQAESELKLLSIDSLSFIGAIVKMEDIFEIEFEPDELEIFAWETVGDIILNVEKKINEKKYA